jgi:hypothetical protein
MDDPDASHATQLKAIELYIKAGDISPPPQPPQETPPPSSLTVDSKTRNWKDCR